MSDDLDQLPSVISPEGMDLLGLGAAAKQLVGPIVRGIGHALEPLRARLENNSKRTQVAAWDAALKTLGVDTKTVEVNIGIRTQVKMLAERIAAQDNKESIAVLAIEHDREDQSPVLPSLEPPDDAWIDHYWRLAENVTEPDMQSFWAIILARRASCRASVSPRTLTFLSTLSGIEAQELERLAQYSIWVEEEGEIDAGIFFHMYDDQPTGSPNILIAQCNSQMNGIVSPTRSQLFRSLGIYVEASFGVANFCWRKPAARSVEFSIADQRYQARFKDAHLNDGNFFIASGELLTPLGIELIRLAGPRSNPQFVEIFEAAVRSRGVELTRL